MFSSLTGTPFDIYILMSLYTYQSDIRLCAGDQPCSWRVVTSHMWEFMPESLTNIIFGEVSRPNLGPIGNGIRDQVDSSIEKDLFEHYWFGSGTDVDLTREQYKRIVGIVAGLKPTGDPIEIVSGGRTLIRKQFAFPDGEFDAAFGTASVFYDKDGNAVGFYDNYNMDIHKRDTPEATLKVGAVQGACILAMKCQPFDISYGTYVKPESE